MSLSVKEQDVLSSLNKPATACFTGYRVQKLPWRNNESDKRCIEMKRVLRAEIIKAVERGYKTFLCGMALGFDIICAETVISLKQEYNDIKLIAAIPCRDQDRLWSENSRTRYRGLLEQADGIRCKFETYTYAECMRERNKYMVDNSSLLIALYSGLPGGTKFTVDYARKSGSEILIIDPEKFI